MSRTVIAVVAPICLVCAGYLLLSPMDSIAVFLSNSIGKILFPRLDSFQRHQKLTFTAGMILVIIVTAGITAFAIKTANRLPHH
ncbi:MAG: hypothetical protein WCS42_18415 [Verrucomicrobiota bacterium]